MLSYLSLLLRIYPLRVASPIDEFEDLLVVAVAGVESIRASRPSRMAHPLSPFSSSVSASMFLARKRRLFKAGMVMPRISAISA